MTPRKAKPTALIPYMRKSSGEDPAGSLERQRRAITRWAEAHDVPLAPEVWEPGVSGKKSWRERGLGEAIAAVERGEAAGIICEEQSRLSRESGLATAEVWDALQKASARLVCTAEGIDTGNGDHELNFALRAALAREQWKQYARRIEAVKARAVGEGKLIGDAPFGYDRVDQRPVPNEHAGTVATLFEMRVAGASWEQLAAFLTEATGRTWSRQGAAAIIRNRAYLGELVYGDLVNEKSHAPLVDAPLFLAANHRQGARTGPKSERWLLSGLVSCAHCGHAMVAWTGAARRRQDPKRGKMAWVKQTPSRRYKCSNRACTARPSVDAPRLEAWAVATSLALGDEVVTRDTAPDLAGLEEALATAERRLEQALTPEAQDALGPAWAATVKERRTAYDAAAAELGTAREAGAPASEFRLGDTWDSLDAHDRRAALALYWRTIKIGTRGAKGTGTPVTFVARGPGASAEVALPA